MASVPNLPTAPAVPAPAAPGAPDAEGMGLDFFAHLLSGGPLISGVVGQLNTLDEVTLRGAPAEGEADGTASEVAPDGSVPADIIPLLQAQSGFPVAVVPAGPTPVKATAPQVQNAIVQPAPNVPAVAPVDGEEPVGVAFDEAEAEAQAQAAVKTVVGKGDDAAAPRREQPGRIAPVTPAPDLSTAPAVETAQQRVPEPVTARIEPAAARIEPAVQPNTPNTLTVPVAPAMPQPLSPAAAPVQGAVPDVAQLIAERKLDLASDNRWLDRLARDIARAGAADEPLRFRLHPQTLGHLQVELTQSERGATVRLTVETEAARNILLDAQPRLAAEARAQGVRLAGTEVDLGTAGQQGDARRNADERPQDIVRVVRGGPSTTNASEPAESRSDRYA